MRHLGNGDPLPVVRRLAHHLCGPHKVLDLIFGEGDSGKDLLADLLTATLGPAGAVKVMLGGSGLTVKDLGKCLSTTSLVFICKVDKTARIPVAALNHSAGDTSVVSMKIGSRAITLPRRGNVILLATWSAQRLGLFSSGRAQQVPVGARATWSGARRYRSVGIVPTGCARVLVVMAGGRSGQRHSG